MVFRNPRSPGTLSGAASVGAVEYEIQAARAEALGRIGERLRHALRALEEFDAGRPDGPVDRSDAPRREDLLSAAGEALWYYVVQREACGLRDPEPVLRELGVPREVELRMGFRRKRP